MDKQKQIEEMAKIMLNEGVNVEKIFPSDALKDSLYRIHLEDATYLYNAGYRKIPENAVVLTREETVDLFNSKASGFMTSAIGDIPLNIDGMRKLGDEVSRLLIVQGELQDLNVKYYNDAKDLRRKLNNDGAIYSRLEVDGFIDKARKETAEKFAERLKSMAYESTDWSHGVHPMVVEVDYIDEICKEFTEGSYGKN